MIAMQPGCERHFDYDGRPFNVGTFCIDHTYPSTLLAGCPPKKVMLASAEGRAADLVRAAPHFMLVPSGDMQVLPRWVCTVALYSTPMQPGEGWWFRPEGSWLALTFWVNEYPLESIPLTVRRAMEKHGLVWQDHAKDWTR